MQKILTVCVDTKQLLKDAGSPFSINEVTGLNEWLTLGWEIQEWDFLKEGENDGEIVLLVVLNDDATYDDDFMDDEFIEDDDDEADEDDEDQKPGAMN